MLKKLVLFTMIFLSPVLLAQTLSIHDIMSQMGDEAKVIGMALRAGPITSVEVASAQKLVILITQAQSVIPDTAGTPELEQQYHSLMADLLAQSQVLEEALASTLTQDPQDLSGVQAAFKALLDLRKQGHELFKP